jgi:hypothetical protein
MDIKQKIELFRKWSATRGQLVSQIDTRHSPHDSNLFSRITCATTLPSNLPGPTTLDTASSSTPASRVLLDQMPPLSLADYFLDQAIDEMEVEPNTYCTSLDSYLSVPFSSSRPILKALLSQPASTPIEASILFDSGASASFVDFKFARRNHLRLSQLNQTIHCRGFNGTLAKSGGIRSCWQGHIHFPAEKFPLQSFPVLLLVTDLASADIILGFPWLSKNHMFVGGSPRILLVPKSLSLLDITISDLPREVMQFKDVFVTDSLSCLPPHQEGYDCEINLKPNSKPPFIGMYHLSKRENSQLRRYVDELLAKGFICESFSPPALPFFL